MGSRGTTGFIIDGQRKSSCQQHDSNLDGVGTQVLDFVKRYVEGGPNCSRDRVLTLARELKIVEADDNPTPEDLKLIQNVYLNQYVSTGVDWYAYLRETQGIPAAILDSGYVCGDDTFNMEEYDYIVNFDAEEFVVYAGGKKIATFQFDNLPTTEEFVNLQDPNAGFEQVIPQF